MLIINAKYPPRRLISWRGRVIVVLNPISSIAIKIKNVTDIAMIEFTKATKKVSIFCCCPKVGIRQEAVDRLRHGKPIL